MKDYYSIKEFAVLLDIHPNTVRAAIKCGRIQAFRIGKGKTSSFRIAHSELLRMPMFDLKKVVEELTKEFHGKLRETE